MPLMQCASEMEREDFGTILVSWKLLARSSADFSIIYMLSGVFGTGTLLVEMGKAQTTALSAVR